MARMLGIGLTGLLIAACILGMQSSSSTDFSSASSVRFIDMAQKAGIDVRTLNGGAETKKYIFESTGSGVALIDYDRDGYQDIFLISGTRLEAFAPSQAPTSRLFHNNRDGTFTDVTARAGVASSGWG